MRQTKHKHKQTIELTGMAGLFPVLESEVKENFDFCFCVCKAKIGFFFVLAQTNPRSFLPSPFLPSFSPFLPPSLPSFLPFHKTLIGMSGRAKPSNLQSPQETGAWLILKEGYLHKTKLAKGLLPSTKLRWFVLKQNPNTFESRLEYYEGRTCKGWISLSEAFVLPTRKMGSFIITTYHKHGSGTVARSMKLQAEGRNLFVATGWLVALSNATKSYKEHSSPSAKEQQQKLEQQDDAERQEKLTPELLQRLEHDESSVAQRASQSLCVCLRVCLCVCLCVYVCVWVGTVWRRQWPQRNQACLFHTPKHIQADT